MTLKGNCSCLLLLVKSKQFPFFDTSGVGPLSEEASAFLSSTATMECSISK